MRSERLIRDAAELLASAPHEESEDAHNARVSAAEQMMAVAQLLIESETDEEC